MKALLKLWLRMRIANELMALCVTTVSIVLAIWFIFFYLPIWLGGMF